MSTRSEKRRVINRKDIDDTCPVDQEVIKILHEVSIGMQAQSGSENTVVASNTPLKVIKMIRKDVFNCIPDILDRDVTDAQIIDVEPKDATTISNGGCENESAKEEDN